jgi:uncharacterized protein
MSVLNFTHYDFLQSIASLEKQIRDSNWLPEIIVGISRGGLVPAVWLSHIFNVPLFPVKCSLTDYAGIDTSNLSTNIHGRKTLIINDIYDSGSCFLELKKYVEQIESDVRWAVIHYNKSGNPRMKPDYIYKHIDKKKEPVWIIYPWET